MAEFDKSKFDPKAAAEARKQEMEEIAKKLEKGVKDVFQGENYKKYLDFCAKLPRYSVNNQILIMMQKPDATMCQSFTGWKEMGRFVKAGEKGIRVLAPSPYTIQKEQDKLDSAGKPMVDKDGENIKEVVEVKVNAFKPVSTFDISQTDGAPIPQIAVDELTGDVEGFETLMEAIMSSITVPISFEKIDSGAKGYYHIEENRIAIQEGMSEAQTVKTILHEASHAELHSKEAMNKNAEKKSRSQKECEAESVAYVVCQHYGIDTSDYSFGYVAGWSGDKEVPELKASLDTIRRTASGLIQRIDEKIQARSNFEEIDKWVEAHADEIPFLDAEGKSEIGYIEITPPVDMNDFKTDIPLVMSKEEPMQGTEDKKEVSGEEPDKKASVKEKLKSKKEQVKQESKPKKAPKKDLAEAI